MSDDWNVEKMPPLTPAMDYYEHQVRIARLNTIRDLAVWVMVVLVLLNLHLRGFL